MIDTLEPRKNAGLFRTILGWAAGDTPPPEALKGAAWNQRAWFAIRQDGTRTCCAAGAAALMAGAVPSMPTPPNPGEIRRFAACRMPGSDWDIPVPGVACRALGLTANEGGILFRPGMELGGLKIAMARFEENAVLTVAELGGEWWPSDLAWSMTAPAAMGRVTTADRLAALGSVAAQGMIFAAAADAAAQMPAGSSW